MFWGISPALDLLEELKTNNELPDVISILIVGGADCRHVLKTLARRYRHKKIKINFYLMELCLETVAKQLLLLYVALRPAEDLALTQKTRIFMELYGNSLVRPAVAKYLTAVASEFVKMITNFRYMKEIMPFVNIELKYKERDYLETLFKFWCSWDDFDICDSWNRRVRKFLGVRYDTKTGAFDWDLHMRYHCVGGQQICNQEYQNWRSTGVAFSWLESEVSKSNRSMVCGVIPNGEKFAHYGYLGDLQTGPFVSFGLKCEDEEFTKTKNGKNAHRATDVTERNLRQVFHELQTNEEYKHQVTTDICLGPVVTRLSEMRVIDIGAAEVIDRGKIRECINVEDTEINFVSLSALTMMKHKEKYKNFFKVMYFGSTYLKYMETEVMNFIAAPNSLLVVENQLFVLNHREKQLNEFGKSVTDTVEGINGIVSLPFDVQKECFAKFILNSR